MNNLNTKLSNSLNSAVKIRGISSAEAQLRHAQYGPNILESPQEASWVRIAYAVVKQPIFLLLIAAGLIYLLLGDMDDAIILMGFISISTGIAVFQQYRSEKTIEALHRLTNPEALVIRNGITTRISAQELVPSDICILREGNRILADAMVIEAHDLMVDESLLTGESIPITKVDKQTVYSGTLVVRGCGIVKIVAIGFNTQIGQIGASLVQIKPAESPLQIEIKLLIRRFAIIGMLVAMIGFTLYGIVQNRWLDGALTGISIAMALLPEEFSVVLTVFLALGIWKISRYHVLTRHAPVIETLGSISTLCVDKTGTLTVNRMELASVAAPSESNSFPSYTVKAEAISLNLQEVISVAMMASEIEPFDQMDKAIHRAYWQYCSQSRLDTNAKLIHEYGLSPTMPVITHIWDTSNTANYYVAAKGSPEAVMNLCNLSENQIQKIESQLAENAISGLRMLGVAKCEYIKSGVSWPNDISEFHFKWLGLIGFSDPLRKTVPDAIRHSREAGIRVVMITGDHPITAKHIANQAGIDTANVLTGLEIESMEKAELQNQVKNTTVFVRITPQQKLRIIQAMQANGDVVAMTGDGINDAPALKAANVGISMGKRGTDVAREASSLVLLNDNFSSLVQAIRQGRRIFDNLQKAINYIIAVHIPIAAAVLLPLILGNPPILSPIHILFLQIIIDPACAVIYEMESEEDDVMKRPPRNLNFSWLSTENLTMAIMQGIGISILLTGCYVYLLGSENKTNLANTAAFTLLAISNLMLILINRSRKKSILQILKIPNPSQKWIFLWVLSALLILISIPHLREKWALTSINLSTGLLIVTATLLGLAWCEYIKWLSKKNHHIKRTQLNSPISPI